jgi:hypothetical protein
MNIFARMGVLVFEECRNEMRWWVVVWDRVGTIAAKGCWWDVVLTKRDVL